MHLNDTFFYKWNLEKILNGHQYKVEHCYTEISAMLLRN